ncbi:MULTISPECIES: MerR family transcriptional regulator [unclassified Caballeronia]|uniref:MerR family transcriptional regulator n=1 Tax=unclassified Caballeronia TaxID=2646786 RepID=UPI00285A21CF|nr:MULTISPECIES: MerR family transcriptional regulator [unclassified Caballeronia]MDR5777618.1 MerR family DNA-binding transcriptional regulator [Caballeronia sp. LZ002]MDR5798640.1 MerR family DNA-binding transcriptional regulator [Caballeronia sp. LZ001]MDR5853051.1 MerR family DNA-binding transcriptional regulator [Caballeronia sp. LZ003]
MKIGELALRTGLAPSRIRFYERIGLLRVVERQANGYRSYPEGALLVLQLITTAQKAGFRLDELRALLPDDLAAWKHGDLIGTLRRKVQDIEVLQVQLAGNRAHLLALLAQIEAKPADIDCAANARRVLSEMQRGTQSGQPANLQSEPPGLGRPMTVPRQTTIPSPEQERCNEQAKR